MTPSVPISWGELIDKITILEIKAELQRHLAGDYTPNLPKAKPVASCGFWGCSEAQSDKPFSSKEFWANKDKDPKGGGGR